MEPKLINFFKYLEDKEGKKTPLKVKLLNPKQFELTPEDLKVACMDLLTYYKDNEASVKSTKAAGTNSTQIEYIQSNSLPAHIRRVFDLYQQDYA